MPEFWIPGAVHRPGPANKTGYPWATVRQGAGVVFHTPEGSFGGALQQLDGPASKSWHGTIDRDGTIYQHYPLDRITWHAGTGANPYYPGFEFVDNGDQSITPEQLEAAVKIVEHLRRLDSWASVARDVTLFEHNHFMPTSCPSGYFPWDQIINLVGAAPSPAVADVARVLGWVVYTFAEGRRSWDLSPVDEATWRWFSDRMG